MCFRVNLSDSGLPLPEWECVISDADKGQRCFEKTVMITALGMVVEARRNCPQLHPDKSAFARKRALNRPA
jgi:hypothetical protein